MTMPADQLEQSLSDLEHQIEAAEKSCKGVTATLKKLRMNAQSGQLRELRKSLSEARQTSLKCAEEIKSADDGWKFDLDSYISSGAFFREMQLIAKTKGLTLTAKGEKIYCFPLIITPSAKDSAVYLGRKAERKLRPSELIRILVAGAGKQAKQNEAPFLEALFGAYRCLAADYMQGWSAETAGVWPAVPLVALYKVLTLRPGSDREYSIEEFAVDVHSLSGQPNLRTKGGLGFSLTASTGSKSAGQRITVFDQHGSEFTYVGIRFQRD